MGRSEPLLNVPILGVWAEAALTVPHVSSMAGGTATVAALTEEGTLAAQRRPE